jgi:hypothetical protein
MRVVSFVLLAVAAVGTACGGNKPDPNGPVAGDLTVSYSGPSQSDGALLVSVTGAVTAVKAAGAYQVASAATGPASTRVVVAGAIVPGDIFKISVPDVGVASTYSIRIEAVADRTTFSLSDTGPYAATARK